ncbi:MAG: flavodoxin [Clostridium sp.]
MINLCFINGSPRAVNKSNSDLFINKLSQYLDDNINIKKYCASKIIKNTSVLDEIIKNDKIVFVSPLYADTLPSAMLEFLSIFDKYLNQNNYSGNIEVYGIINCGFFEGNQCRYALQMFKYFCRKTNLKWRFGIGIGGGEYLKNALNNSIHAESLYKAFNLLGSDINNPDYSLTENIYLSPDKMSAGIYRASANLGWCISAFKDYKTLVPSIFRKIY